MNNEKMRPKVGVGVLILRNGKVLLGKRSDASKHGFATWAPPGGHLEFFETFEQCAQRETLEETGLAVTNIRFCSLTNDFFTKENKHYITVFMAADSDSTQEPQLMEPDRCETWQWFAFSELPKELFVSFKNLMNQGFSAQALEKTPKSGILNL